MSRSSAGQIAIHREILDSAVFQGLSGGAVKMYLQILRRRRWARVGKEKKWTCMNESNIQFSRQQAEKVGIPRTSYYRCGDELIRVGFLDINPGNSGGPANSFAISDRWMKYGRHDFEEKERPKDYRQWGFKKPKRSVLPSQGKNDATVCQNDAV